MVAPASAGTLIDNWIAITEVAIQLNFFPHIANLKNDASRRLKQSSKY
jgi:hypothetical protein